MGRGARTWVGENIFAENVAEAFRHMCMHLISCFDHGNALCVLHACTFESGGMPTACISKLVMT